MKRQIGNDQIVKIIEREQVISYKKKTEHKPVHKPSKQDEEDFQSATSLKSNVFSEDSVKFNKKNTPLPQLNKERRKIFARGLMYNQNKPTPSFQQKQVRQHDNLVLKQQNNHLTTENMKLKTRLMTLEKQNIRLQKILEDDSSKVKPSATLILGKQAKLTKLNPQSSSMKMLIRNLKKELEQVKKENTKIKWSIKFTRISQLQIQRQNILEETTRLRAIIQQQLGKRANMKIKQNGLSNLQHKVITLQQKNNYLVKQKLDLQNKLKKLQQTGKNVEKISQNEKNLNKMLFNARRVIKEKQKQIQEIKSQQSSSSNSNIHSFNTIPGSNKNTQLSVVQSSKQTSTLPVSKKEISNKRINSKEKRAMSKSAQKYRANAVKTSDYCESCKRISQQNNVLLRKIEQLTNQIKAQKEKNSKKEFGELSKGPVERPTAEAIQTVGRFLTYRFKAHHLSLQEAQKYLVSNETAPITQTEMTVSQIVESLVAEPFSIISNSYLESIITGLFYVNETGNKITFDQNKKMKKENIIANFRKIVKPYELMSQAKQEEMFIQIAQLVTNYHQHILTALNGKRNGEGTITEQDLTFFFNQIELQKQYVEFIITQIILESYGLMHLNYYAMFQIFYMPTQQISEVGTQVPLSKKKFQVDQFNVVKQQDQQYEQSRSHVDAKQKTQSRRDQEQYEQQYQQQIKKKTHSISNAPRINLTEKLNASNIESRIEEQNQMEQIQGNSKSNLQKKVSQEYEEQFQQEKIQVAEEQEKTNNHKPYALQEELQDYKDEFEG